MCVCLSGSAVLCWCLRYKIEPIEYTGDDGGPCMCECHDGCDDDDEAEHPLHSDDGDSLAESELSNDEFDPLFDII